MANYLLEMRLAEELVFAEIRFISSALKQGRTIIGYLSPESDAAVDKRMGPQKFQFLSIDDHNAEIIWLPPSRDGKPYSAEEIPDIPQSDKALLTSDDYKNVNEPRVVAEARYSLKDLQVVDPTADSWDDESGILARKAWKRKSRDVEEDAENVSFNIGDKVIIDNPAPYGIGDPEKSFSIDPAYGEVLDDIIKNGRILVRLDGQITRKEKVPFGKPGQSPVRIQDLQHDPEPHQMELGLEEAKTIKVGEDSIGASSTAYALVKERKILALGEKTEMLQRCESDGGRVWVVSGERAVGDLVESVESLEFDGVESDGEAEEMLARIKSRAADRKDSESFDRPESESKIRPATKRVLQHRAIRLARNLVFKKESGGKTKSELLFPERLRIEKIVASQKDVVMDLARQLYPIIDQKEQDRKLPPI